MFKIFKKKKELPKVGSFYTHIKKGAFYGFIGIVGHHDCGTRFYIYNGKSTLTDIEP